MLVLGAAALSPGGLTFVDFLLLFCFALTLPWMTVGFWNAAIGFLIARFAADPLRLTIPCAATVSECAPIISSTAILLCIRNESTDRLVRNLRSTMSDLVASGNAQH